MKQFDLLDEDEQIAFLHLTQVPGMKVPSVEELMESARRHGDDGVLESAYHLNTKDFDRLVEVCKESTSKIKRIRRKAVS